MAVVALLLALGLAACGGDDSSDSASTEAAAEAQPRSESSGDGSKQGEAGSGGDDGKSDSGDEEGSGSFTPKQHDDSGGGSEQFRVKGGDNSVQDFGDEADTSEREAAATVLHSYLDARAAGDWDAACSYISASFRESLETLGEQAKQLADRSCGGILEILTNPAAGPSMKAEAAQADVASLRIEGERAFAIYTGVGDTVLAMPMANEDGAWKVSSAVGTPIA